ncbi:MAG: hypothetical protein ABID45_01070 [Patescibacteria group bacterium]
MKILENFEKIKPTLSGYIYTDSNHIIIEALFGYFTMESQPDIYKIDKKTKEIIDVQIKPQDFMVIKKGKKIKHKKIRVKQIFSQKLTDNQISEILKNYKKPNNLMAWAFQKKKLFFMDVGEGDKKSGSHVLL